MGGRVAHTLHVLAAAISRMARCVREASAPRRENSLAECVSAGLLRFDYLVISGVSEAIFEDQRAVRFSAARRGPRAALAWHNQLMATNNLPLPTPAPPTDPLASGKRLAGWEHYYTYFHKLDADMQVSETRRCRCLSLFA